MRLSELPTPQVLVDPRRVRANIAQMQAAASVHGLNVRPHAKTHKSPVIARKQVDAGAVGVCCAKVGEAEVFVDAGITNVRLPYPVHPSNASRVLALMERAELSLIIDHPDNAEGWSDAMTRAGRRMPVLVKVDVGFHRCGVDPDSAETLPFIRHVAALPGLEFLGLLSHAGQSYHAESEDDLRAMAAAEADTLKALADALERDGIPVRERSVGSTPTARYSLMQPGLTEIRAGNYVYYDRTQVGLGAASREDCALTVLATVVTKPRPDRLILDCGSKTLTNDQARGFSALHGYGEVLKELDHNDGDETLLVERLSEEHATVRALNGSTSLKPGDRVRVLPNHACVVSNLVDRIYLAHGDTVVDSLPVAARGRIQ
ncbi:MAG: alanine racemase [Vicinamibacterales bacterium]